MGAGGWVGESTCLLTRVRDQVHHVAQPQPLFKNFFVQQPDCQAKAARALNLELPLKFHSNPAGNELACGSPLPPKEVT